MKKFILFFVLISGSVFGYQQEPTDIVASVKEAANADEISNEDLAIWYSIYRGTYLYGTKFDFDKAKDFGDIFDKQREIRDKLMPEKTKKFGPVINSIFLKYEELPFDDNNKNKFLEECNKVTEGIKAGID